MDSAFLLSLQQLVLNETPLTLSEARELFLRQAVSNPRGPRAIMMALSSLYEALHYTELGTFPDHIPYEEVREVVRRSFREGFIYVNPNHNPDEYFRFPACLIDRDYPTVLIEQVGTVMGYEAAKALADLPNPSNV